MEFISRKLKFKTPFGAAEQGEKITISTLASPDAEVFIIIEKDGEFYKEEKLCYCNSNGMHTVTFSIDEVGLFFYMFTENKNPVLKNGKDKWQLLVYKKGFDTPDDYKGKIMYQIFPDRFYKEGECSLDAKLTPFWVHASFDEVPSHYPDNFGKIPNNDFYGGNLRGIEKKLPYLKELGIDILYLNPVFMSFSNHRYDTADYKKIDPMLGNENDFVSLCKEVHKLGMKIILDGVFSHTGETSVYFDKYNTFGCGACSGPGSPYFSWYTFQEFPHKYTSWWGIEVLPCVNENDESYREFVLGEDGVVSFWQRRGADGFRLDVADELPDEFIEELYERVKKNSKDAFVLGEVWEDASNKISYGKRRRYLYGNELDSVMNYVYKNAITGFVRGYISSDDFYNEIETVLENYPRPYWHTLMNMLSTHDTPRILTAMGSEAGGMSKNEKALYKMNNEEYAVGKARMFACVFLQFTLPGMPSVYYGDEIGMQGWEDPFNRAFFSWWNIDDDVLNYYRGIIKLRKEYKALQYGGYESMPLGGRAISFKRMLGGEVLQMFLNTGDDEVFVCRDGRVVVFEKNVRPQNDGYAICKYGMLVLVNNKKETEI